MKSSAEKATLQRQGKVRALKRLILAHITFQQVISACDFLIAHDSDERAQFYGTFFTGICVTYTRPFMSSELGPLSSKYAKFPEETDHSRTHQDLANGRNCTHAHNSPNQTADLLFSERQKEEQRKIRFTCSPTGIMFHPPEVTWSKNRLPVIVSLCRFQMERIALEVRDLVEHLGQGRVYKDGEYIIGETFP
jgi:hypothetical protein